jgi:hypothetical protein
MLTIATMDGAATMIHPDARLPGLGRPAMRRPSVTTAPASVIAPPISIDTARMKSP